MAEKKGFDFYGHVHDILRKRYGSSFIPYHEVYSYLGRRFCFKKWELKDLLRSMEAKGYLEMKKRGIILVEHGQRQGEQNDGEESSGRPGSLRRRSRSPESVST